MVYVFLAEGFEEIEALTPVDVLRRAGVETRTVCVGEGLCVKGAHGIEVTSDMNIKDVDVNTVETAVLPGGMPGAVNLDASRDVQRILDFVTENGKLAAAICAAPMILGKRGDLAGKKAVCYPGFEKYLKGAATVSEGTVRDGNVITSKGMGKALDFGLLLVSAIKGPETADRIRNSVFG